MDIDTIVAGLKYHTIKDEATLAAERQSYLKQILGLSPRQKDMRNVYLQYHTSIEQPSLVDQLSAKLNISSTNIE